jgi:hypothetical protein
VPVEIVDGDLRAVVTVLALHGIRAGFREQHSELDGFLGACGHHERRFQVEHPGRQCGGKPPPDRAAEKGSVAEHFPMRSWGYPPAEVIPMTAQSAQSAVVAHHVDDHADADAT